MEKTTIAPWLNRQRAFAWMVVTQLGLPMDLKVAESIRAIFFTNGSTEGPLMSPQTWDRLYMYMLSLYPLKEVVKPGLERGFLSLHRSIEGNVISEVFVTFKGEVKLLFTHLQGRQTHLGIGNHAIVKWSSEEKMWLVEKYHELSKAFYLSGKMTHVMLSGDKLQSINTEVLNMTSRDEDIERFSTLPKANTSAIQHVEQSLILEIKKRVPVEELLSSIPSVDSFESAQRNNAKLVAQKIFFIFPEMWAATEDFAKQM